jgi:hypothetical protein
MRKRLHDKKAGIVILFALIAISLADVIFRAVSMGKAVLTTANLGEQLAVIALAVTILILTAKGNDRACYICYGAWIGYFVLDQLFELPGMITNFISIQINGWSIPIGNIGILLQIFSMICIIAIGCLLVEYMNDGTIYNKAFNILCVLTVLSQLIHVIIGILLVTSGNPSDKIYILAILDGLSNVTMVFMFTFFAYDSAKHKLKKANLKK